MHFIPGIPKVANTRQIFWSWLFVILGLIPGLIASFIPLRSWAQYEDDSFFNYEAIITDLKSSTSTTKLPTPNDPFADIQIHGGVGIVTSLLTVKTPDRVTRSGFQNGFEASLGIDLFSPRWMAEGAIRRYTSSELDRFTTVTLHEFDLRAVYRTSPHRYLRWRFGMGLAGRFLEIKSRIGEALATNEYSTPSSIVSIGIESSITREFSVGTELSYRSAIIEETSDRSAIDGSIKLGAHF